MSSSRTQHSDAGEAQPAAPRSRVKHSTTEPLCSPGHLVQMLTTLNMVYLDQILHTYYFNIVQPLYEASPSIILVGRGLLVKLLIILEPHDIF